ncbi:MAG: coenzyme F420-reducing hydrogenase, FrhD protein [Methanosarcinaceae archaeon]|nr:coenzyme F420-reducing hydrogenase, FrhD protein [Methanosarcinaceae archaeon]
MADYLDKEILILGCGNILLGDDGFGPAVVAEMNKIKESEPKLRSEGIDIIDAGTAASYFIISLIDETSAVKKIIIADIIDYGLKPGTLKRLTVEDLPNISKYHMDAHDMPLAGMLRDVYDNFGVEVVVIGCQFENMPAPDICVELSDVVKKSINPAIEMILDEL